MFCTFSFAELKANTDASRELDRHHHKEGSPGQGTKQCLLVLVCSCVLFGFSTKPCTGKEADLLVFSLVFCERATKDSLISALNKKFALNSL